MIPRVRRRPCLRFAAGIGEGERSRQQDQRPQGQYRHRSGKQRCAGAPRRRIVAPSAALRRSRGNGVGCARAKGDSGGRCGMAITFQGCVQHGFLGGLAVACGGVACTLSAGCGERTSPASPCCFVCIASCASRAQSSGATGPSIASSATTRRTSLGMNGFSITGRPLRDTNSRSAEASVSPVTNTTRPARPGQRCSIAS